MKFNFILFACTVVTLFICSLTNRQEMSSSLMDSLVQNTKYITRNGDNEQQSACELKCRSEQQALVSCVDFIRSEKNHGYSSSPQSCLAPAVSAWTKCCSEANES